MFSTKQLSEEQIATIKSWAAAGARLPDIQLKMHEEMNLPITYMDTRFVILDLGIELAKDDVAVEVPDDLAQEESHTGGVQVTMDDMPLSGMIVSGKAVFSDGERAIWTIDQNGQPGLEPETAAYDPTEEDIVEFQKQLRALIQSLRE
ncbi:hypothetical protein ACFSSA_10735 [Luteolibacter algae]|uniref:Uncharacterized protein n=1 Tax=Luteolibacter algae TaxID=454151 RepID=A0ABW5DCN5_9BACT